MARSVLYSATDADVGKRIDVVISAAGLYKSRSAAQAAIQSGRVLVFGSPVSKKHTVCAGDMIVCELDEESAQIPISGEPIDIDVRYEDDDIIVLSKQAGLITHPNDDYRSGTLVNALIHRYGKEGLCNVQGADERLGIVHRLDADTSGIMLAAKTDDAGEYLMDEIRLRNVDRRYIALIHGIMNPDSGMIDAPIARNPNDRKSMAVIDNASARDAITTFKVLERFEAGPHDDGYTLIECKLYTGRTHQIRVHMQYIKHPIVGDPLYTAHGPKNQSAQLGLARQFLHSYRIAFKHPNGETLSFVDSLPTDLLEALLKIKSRSLGKTDEGISESQYFDPENVLPQGEEVE